MAKGSQEETAAPRATRAERLQRDEYVALRRAIVAAMASSGIGQRELSRLTGQTFAFTNKILRGDRTLEFTELLDIARALGKDPLELVRDSLAANS